MAKLWLNERVSIDVGDRKDLSTELVTRTSAGDLWSAFYNRIENPDPILRKANLNITVFDELKRDPQVASCTEGRQSGVLKMVWRIDQGDAKPDTADIITDMFSTLRLQDIMREILNARFYGYEVQEVVWAIDNDFIYPARIQEKPHEWFSFDNDNKLLRRNGNSELDWKICEKLKFLLTTSKASYKNPFGESLYGMCFWPVTFKKGGIKNWAIFLEKFGMPHALGKLPRGAEHAKRQELLGALHRMVRDACAVFPDDSSIELIESTAKGATSDLYERHTVYHDGEISKILLGHNAAVDSTPGRLGNETTGLTVREDLVDSDVLLVQETMNELIRWICAVNTSLGPVPPKFVLAEKEKVDKTVAERDKTVTECGNVKFTKKYYQKAHGYEDDDIIVDESPTFGTNVQTPGRASLSQGAQPIPGAGSHSVEFAEPAETFTADQALSKLSSAITDADLQSQMEEILSTIFDLSEQSDNYSQFKNGLKNVFTKLKSEKLTETLEKTALLADVWGRLNAGNE